MILAKDFLNLKFMKIFKKEYEVTDLESLREVVTNSIFTLFSILSIFAFIISMSLSLSKGEYLMALVTTGMYTSFIILSFNRSISYKVKGGVIMALTSLFGFYLIVTYGPSSTGNIWLITSAIYCSIIFSGKLTIILSALLLLGYISLTPMVNKEIFSWVSKIDNPIRVWAINGTTTMLIAFSVSISLSIFLNGFSTTLNRIFADKKATILGLAKLAEHKDMDTGKHIIRLQKYSEIITTYLFNNHNSDGYITRDYIDDIRVSSTLHDIGKVGIRDSILQKPGRLTIEEFEEMKLHTILGGDVISEIEKNIPGRSIYSIGKEIACCHHEKWNGTGYPYGLVGEKIPLSARIVAIVDVYDALTSRRPYKDPLTHEEALSIITRESGEHFDPLMVEALIMNESSFKHIAMAESY